MQSIMQWAITWTRIDPNTGLTPIPSRSGLIYLTPSLYGTLLLVYFVLAILTILFPSEPIKCSKEAVYQLRPCFMDFYINILCMYLLLYQNFITYNLSTKIRNKTISYDTYFRIFSRETYRHLT